MSDPGIAAIYRFHGTDKIPAAFIITIKARYSFHIMYWIMLYPYIYIHSNMNANRFNLTKSKIIDLKHKIQRPLIGSSN